MEKPMSESSLTHATEPASGPPDAGPPGRSPRQLVLLGVALAAAVGLGWVVGYEQYASRPAKVITALPARACPAAAASSPGEVRINGVVENRSDTSFTVRESTKARSQVSVTVGSAPICRSVAAGTTDIQSGDRVTVRGTQSTGGVNAEQVTIASGANGG
jgi:hypothetical protein